jgi:hypothetical protein
MPLEDCEIDENASIEIASKVKLLDANKGHMSSAMSSGSYMS